MAIMKYHRVRGLGNRRLFITDLEAGKSKIKVLADVVPGEDLFMAGRQPPS